MCRQVSVQSWQQQSQSPLSRQLLLRRAQDSFLLVRNLPLAILCQTSDEHKLSGRPAASAPALIGTPAAICLVLTWWIESRLGSQPMSCVVSCRTEDPSVVASFGQGQKNHQGGSCRRCSWHDCCNSACGEGVRMSIFKDSSAFASTSVQPGDLNAPDSI